jgi:hypothetical protein
VNLAEAVNGIVERLQSAGIGAADDARNINPPAVLVRAPSIAYRFGKGGYTASWELWAIVPDVGQHDALAAVSELIDQVQAALSWHLVDGRPDNVALPDSSMLPCYILTFTETLR